MWFEEMHMGKLTGGRLTIVNFESTFLGHGVPRYLITHSEYFCEHDFVRD